MMVITSVSSSSANVAIPLNIVIPPTFSDKSLPPVPIAFVTPSPNLSIIVDTSWIPVPDAPTIPIFPSFMSFVKAMGTLLITPVPLSGPIHNKPFSLAFSFIFNSSSTSTLSLNINTFKSSSKALLATLAAYTPGTDTTAKYVSGNSFNAASQYFIVFSIFSPLVPLDCSDRNLSTSSNTVSITSSFSASTTIAISLAVASSSSGVLKPLLSKISLFAGVAIIIETLLTPSNSEISLVNNINTTES